MSTQDPRSTWERYVAAWKAETEADKRALFAAALSPSCVYTDPLTVAHGWDELAAYMHGFHRDVPGGHFVTEAFHTHHGRSAARWTMRSGEGAAIGDGISYAEYDADGKLTSMTGFFEVPPSTD